MPAKAASRKSVRSVDLPPAVAHRPATRRAMQPDCRPEDTTPMARYQRRVAAGELRVDRAQLAAMRRLNALHQAILSRPPTRGGIRHAIAGLGRRLRGRRHASRGLYLCGGVGTGKTLLMDIFYHALPAGLGERIHFHRFMQSVHDAKSRLHARQRPLAIIAAAWARRHRVLCLDEFSVGDIADAMILSGLLRELFSRGVILVTTANLPPEQLYWDGLQRQRFLPAIELLKEQTRLIKVDGGNDYRMQRLMLGSLYHVPHNQRARRALRRSFAALEGAALRHDEACGQDEALLLSGREVPVIKAGRGTAWFGFDVLCAGNRSKVDYIELAKRFHTVILADIPALDADHDDAARRLIELIDELYDRGVNLIASAARPPVDLYRGSRLKQPFARTASRLREMGSRDYLARPHLP